MDKKINIVSFIDNKLVVSLGEGSFQKKTPIPEWDIR